MALKKGIKQLLEEAAQRIKVISTDDGKALLEDSNTVFIDLRDVRELEREGTIPGAYHAPRGMLEFWADPESPYHKEIFSSGKNLVLYCQSAWRSTLATATLVDMGLENVSHLEGGFSAWKDAGGPIAAREKKS